MTSLARLTTTSPRRTGEARRDLPRGPGLTGRSRAVPDEAGPGSQRSTLARLPPSGRHRRSPDSNAAGVADARRGRTRRVRAGGEQLHQVRGRPSDLAVTPGAAVRARRTT